METWKTAVHSWQLFQQIPTCLFHACLPAIKGTKVRELSLSEMFFYAEGVVVQGCVCLCVFVSSITKVQFGATKSVNRKSTWRSKTCTGKKLRTRRHKMQDESSSNGWVQAANGQEVNAGKVPFWSCMCVSHTHTHIQSEVNCRPTHTRPLDVTSAVHLLFYCRSPGAVYVCVCVAVCCSWRCARVTCHVPIAAYWASFFRLLVSLFSLLLPSRPQPSVKVLRFMSKWFVRLPRHLISFLSLFRFHCFTVQRATYTQRNTTELQINKTLLHQTELLSIIYRADNITKHIRSRLRMLFFQCSICSYGILQIVMTHVNNVFSAYFVLALLCHLPLASPLPLPTVAAASTCVDITISCLWWIMLLWLVTAAPAPSPSGFVCVQLGSILNLLLTFHSTIFQLLPLNCVICGACYCTHTHARRAYVQVC